MKKQAGFSKRDCNINFRLSPELHARICREVGERMVKGGVQVALSDIVREAVENHFTILDSARARREQRETEL